MKEQKFLFISLILLFLVGGPAMYSVVNEPVIKANLTGNLYGRLPASSSTKSATTKAPSENTAEDEIPHHNAIKAKSVTVEISCAAGDQTQETDGTLLRLKSECWKAESKGISVINKTNGFTASIIETKTQGFTTDFMDLQEGENHLEIVATNLKGEAIRKVMTVRRRLPAAEAFNQ